ncbi:MAG TPA: helix-turn-helix transcriptional regulator [Spirochaetota bacterium]|nr:helix-turn-helix transcriptional regulator [Spirochaetota bacterium]
MSDLKKYINKRKASDPDFAQGYDIGLEEFKIGLVLRQEREKSGLTQEELAKKIKTTKSAISRIENHSEDIKLSTLMKVAKALGKNVSIKLM